MLEVTFLPFPLPLLKWTGPNADYKIAPGPFLFCLDKAAVACAERFPRSAFILDRTASVWRNEDYNCFFVLFLFCFSRTPRLYHRSLQTKKPLKQLRKPSKPPATYRTRPKLATKVGLITVCKGESSVGYKIDCFANNSTEERERRN